MHKMSRGDLAGNSHLTLEQHPRIVKAKLGAGFLHVGIAVPATAIEAVPFSLCRFNAALTRQLRRDGNPGFPESSTNGRYYDQHQIPIARTDEDKAAMLDKHLPIGTMIEVFVHGDFELPTATEVICYSDADLALAKRVLTKVGVPWTIKLADASVPYPRSAKHAQSVEAFIEQALGDPAWRGNGLEFDRL